MLGKAVKKTPCKLPIVPVPSQFHKAPTNLPIDFYAPKWYKALGPGQCHIMVDQEKVCFLPDASQSLLPTRQPDKLLSNTRFTAKYLDSIMTNYQLEEEGNVENEDEEEELTDKEMADDDEDGKAEDDDHFKMMVIMVTCMIWKKMSKVICDVVRL
ncbi:hypothetical protein DFH28DRAFT_1130678 [Melampsora americana]|nr:hypothetical protein DFH28DRAFT_1130678 [Melampsora americana]